MLIFKWNDMRFKPMQNYEIKKFITRENTLVSSLTSKVIKKNCCERQIGFEHE
jgi:hypothetical protein